VILPEIQAAIAQASIGGGQPIPEPVRAPLEQAIGAQFDGVRVHTGERADDLARSLRARAFTTGRDIFFRQGQYQPSTSAGQQVLAHELAHVVQQADSSAQGGRALVQRAVGLEFETDWGIHGLSDPAVQAPAGKRLKKHTAYKQGQGFTVQVDEASRGWEPGYDGLNRQIEFVVDPHPESVEGGQRLNRTMRALIAEVTRLDDLRKQSKNNQKRFPYPGTTQKTWVFPEAKTTAIDGIHARAQATVGLSLPAISRLALMEEEKLRATSRTQGIGVSYAHRGAVLPEVKGEFIHGAAAAEQIKGASPELRGLVTLLALYIKVFHGAGTKKKPYVKGYLPLLAKTNFATMYMHLPPLEREQYRSDPEVFVDFVLRTVNKQPGFKNVRKEWLAIPPGLLKGTKPFNLTLEEWLSTIPFGSDLLTTVSDKRLFGLGDLGEGQEKGKKVDIAPGKGSRRMILEFRAGSPIGTGFITPSQWLDFAFDYFNLARRLHGRKPAAEWGAPQPAPQPQPGNAPGAKPKRRATAT
jgi:hypothetical protein